MASAISTWVSVRRRFPENISILHTRKARCICETERQREVRLVYTKPCRDFYLARFSRLFPAKKAANVGQIARDRGGRERVEKSLSISHCLKTRIEDGQHAAIIAMTDYVGEQLKQREDSQLNLAIAK